MRRLRHLMALAGICLLLISAQVAFAQSEERQGTTVSGMVRVYLSSIGSRQSVDLRTDGSYSIGGKTSRAIARGAKLTVSNSGGALYLTMGGERQAMGARFTLTRHETSGNNGVYIEQARYPANLYPGDMEFIAKGSNVQIIVHVYMEDYMQGVLPYEMDNSFPLETLKAQAVAARTYALRKMSQHASTYDVVDTTSDQVYNGTPMGNARCKQAVQETSGIIGLVGGEFMASYYTASNGGQTESVANAWGSSSYAYLTVKDDPYDLRNSASIQKSVMFYSDGTTNVSKLTALLEREAAKAVGAESVKLEAITSVVPHTPKYAPPSRVYTKLNVGVKPAGHEPITITLDYFSQIEGICSLSINTLKNEIIEVTKTVAGFKLTARRFGHGVGMSQRGAQQMGEEGLSYDEILDFYYPGIVRTRYTMTRSIQPSMDGTKPQPTQAPVSESSPATISLSNPLASVTMRSGKKESAPVLRELRHGEQVLILSREGEWSFIQSGTLSGYVPTSCLLAGDDIAHPGSLDLAPSKGSAMVVLSDESQTLNLRVSPTVSADVLAGLRHGQTLDVVERYDRWTCVRVDGLTGYVLNAYVAFDASTDEQESLGEKEEIEGRRAIVLPSAGLRLRASEAADSGVVMILQQGAILQVYGEAKNGMLPVGLGGIRGYVSSDYVYVTDEPLATPEPTPEATAEPMPEPTAEPTPEPTAEPIESDRADEGEPRKEAEERSDPAVVTASSGLKLRDAPSASAETLATMPSGAQVVVTGREENEFYPVQYGEFSGFAGARYLKLMGSDAPAETVPTATSVPQASHVISFRTATVSAESGLKLRRTADAKADVLTTLGYGVELLVTGEAENGYYPVQVGSLAGYVSRDFISFEKEASPESTAAPAPSYAAGSRVVVSSENGLNLRAQPNAQSEILYVLPYGMVLTVRGEQNGYLDVEWAEYRGFVSREFVSLLDRQSE